VHVVHSAKDSDRLVVRTRRSFGSTIIAAAAWRVLALCQRWLPRDLPRLACVPGDFVGKHIVCNGVFERELLEYLRALLRAMRATPEANSVMLDVGANIGNHTCFLANDFGRTIAFEPSKRIAALLRANVAINGLESRVTVAQCALSDENVSGTHHFAGDQNAGGSFVSKGSSLEVHKSSEGVRLLRGDDFLQENLATDEFVALVKIDVEGHEHEVMIGLSGTLQLHQPLVLFEASDGRRAAACMELLSRCGYDRFFEVDSDSDAGLSSVFRLLRRLRSGGKTISVRHLRHAEDRYYEAILAVPNRAARLHGWLPA